MVTFLFWNTNGKPLVDALVAIAEQEAVDILILAEWVVGETALLTALNHREPAFHLAPGHSRGITIVSRFHGRYLMPVFESDRVSIRRVMLPGCDEILLVAVHFPSKLYWSDASQQTECTVLGRTIVEQETQAGHNRTMVVGDLNMNPFESGVVAAGGLNATMTQRVAARGDRIVQGQSYPFFYNPMWGQLGDQSKGPPGSYYYERAEHITYFWNTFDQVLLRPQLMDRLLSGAPRILDAAGNISLVKPDGRPDLDRASDHLPLLFRLDL
ncbi:MAG TPA: endonuclease/exonuclease/phosphatase family protein [Bryobacteraceae bacterium]|nr:endonuclease/exonuclease/phosphatase family protein [Bryobacteraceae bacterium]